ncbi:hypothetical protein ACET9F_21510, partial [Aeromonas veronii]
MARQVRPWLVKPEGNKVLQVRGVDSGASQRIPSGIEAVASIKIRIYGCNLHLTHFHGLSRHSAPDLGINLPIALTQYLQNDLLV